GLQWASGNTTDLTAAPQFNRNFYSSDVTFDTNGNNVTFGSGLSGVGDFIKLGARTLTLASPLELLANPANPTIFTIARGSLSGGIDLDLAGVVHGSGTLVKNGPGTLRLTGTNTYSGGTNINGGLVNFNALSNFGSGTITLNGGGLQWAS